jgi:hypothetical protein
VAFTVVVIGATIIAVTLFGFAFAFVASVREEKRARRRVRRVRKVRAIGKGVYLEIW